jgi:enoyl-CoA hydratase/carnithine racemase
MKEQYGDIAVTMLDGHVAQCEIQRAPNNFFDYQLIADMVECFEDIDKDNQARAIVLCAEGKHFCAGLNFDPASEEEKKDILTAPKVNPVYAASVKLFRCETPVIAAVQGGAIGGGFGLALMADFRVVCPNTRMTANFVKLGFVPGFGLTHTLQRVVGQQKANTLFYTGRRINGQTAFDWGLGDVYASNETIRDEAIKLAREIAENAPLAVVSVRKIMRQGLSAAIDAATEVENAEQYRLRQTEDHLEGVKAVIERRAGNFKGC